MRYFKPLTEYIGIFLIIILSFWSIKPFFQPGFFPVHDDTQVARVFEMGNSLKDGMFPVRWVNHLGYGYGYPIFNFYAPLAYYIGGFLILFGLNALLATKVIMISGIILSGICMYLLAKEFWGKTGGLFSALLYLYAPYHAVDIYVRGDVAEFWAYAFIPLVFLGFYNIVHEVRNSQQSRKKFPLGILVGGVGYAGVILSHNLTAVMITIFLAVFLPIILFLSKKRKHIFYYFSQMTLLGLMISAFYWLPAITEISYTNVLSQIGGSADFHEHFVCIQQFWYSPWGFGGSGPGCNDGLSFMVGKIYFLFLSLSLISGFLFWKKNKYKSIAIFMALFGFLFSLFLQTQYSQFIWDTIKPMSFLQYPWRFLLFSAFFSSFLGGSSIFYCDNILKINRKVLQGITIFAVIFLIYTETKFFLPQKILHVSSDYYTTISSLTWRESRISDEYMPPLFSKPQKESLIPQKSLVIPAQIGLIEEAKEYTQEKIASVLIKTSLPFFIHLAYFPSWHATIDNYSIPVTQVQGKIVLMLPPGHHLLDIKFTSTFLEQIANALSFIGIAWLFLDIIKRKRNLIHDNNQTNS